MSSVPPLKRCSPTRRRRRARGACAPIPDETDAVMAAIADVAATARSRSWRPSWAWAATPLRTRCVRCRCSSSPRAPPTHWGKWRRTGSGGRVTRGCGGPEYARARPRGRERDRRVTLRQEPEGCWLDPVRSRMVLGAAGVGAVDQRLVDDADAAVAAASELGHAVAIKATGLERLAKTEAGGVAVDVHGDDEVRQAYERMVGSSATPCGPQSIQAMAPAGVDVWSRSTSTRASARCATWPRRPRLAGCRTATQVLPMTDADAARLMACHRLLSCSVRSALPRSPH